MCDTAKRVIDNVRATRNLEYNEIDVMRNAAWKTYEFDVPVVSGLHQHAMLIILKKYSRSMLSAHPKRIRAH